MTADAGKQQRVVQTLHVGVSLHARKTAAEPLAIVMSARERLPGACIPIRAAGFAALGLRLQELTGRATEEASRVSMAADDGGFTSIRIAAVSARDFVLALDRTLWAASLFKHETADRIRQIHQAVHALGMGWLERLETGERQPEGFDWISHAQLWTKSLSGNSPDRQEPDCSEVDPDPWVEVLGISRGDAIDADGRFSASLVLASFHGRLDDLSIRLEQAFSGFSAPALDPMKALRYLPALLDPDDPVETVQAALEVRALIDESLARDVENTTSALTALLLDVERSYSNHIMTNDTIRRMEGEKRQDRRAMLALDVYRRVAEGQVRPCAWTLIRLQSGAAGFSPMVGELVHRLRTPDGSIFAGFVDCLDVSARNDAAHEDYRWDPARQRLVGKLDEHDPGQLLQRADRGLRLMSGMELGWALATAGSQKLRENTRLEGAAAPEVLQIMDGLLRFGTNRIRVRSWERRAEGLTIQVESLSLSDYSPCAQALIEMSACVETPRLFVELPDSQGPVMTASRSVLDASLPVWFITRARRASMPPALFLPILYESRLLIESLDTALAAVEWLALNEAYHFILDAETQAEAGTDVTKALTELTANLDLVVWALRTCAPTDSRIRAGFPFRLIEAAAVHARISIERRGRESGAAVAQLKRLADKIIVLWSDCPPCAPLPTVDPSPLRAD